MNFYRIRDWAKHFENNRTRELKYMDWVPVPNKHDGDGFTELLNHPQGLAHYGAWHLVLQVASKCEIRGTLLRDGAGGGKRPHTPESLARITRGDEKTFKAAIDRLVSIGWIEVCDDPALSCDNPAPCCGEVTTERNGTERNGNDRKEGGNPSLEDVKTRASMTGMPESDAVAFWNHFESSGWIDKHGHPILNWKAKMDNWKVEARAAPFEKNHKSIKQPQIQPKREFKSSAIIPQ